MSVNQQQVQVPPEVSQWLCQFIKPDVAAPPDEQDLDCPVCLEPFSEMVQPIEVLSCSHRLCFTCAGTIKHRGCDRNIDSKKAVKCPICREVNKISYDELLAAYKREKRRANDLSALVAVRFAAPAPPAPPAPPVIPPPAPVAHRPAIVTGPPRRGPFRVRCSRVGCSTRTHLVCNIPNCHYAACSHHHYRCQLHRFGGI